MNKFVYFFGRGLAEGDESMHDLLGGKGGGLAGMTRAGLPVPPGFTISTEACRVFIRSGGELPDGLDEQVAEALQRLEDLTGQGFGSADKPLLLSVRSGARFSMPGMMDTILNLGINPEIVASVIRRTGDPRFGWDCYRRFLQMFGTVVLSVSADTFDEASGPVLSKAGVGNAGELSAQGLQRLAAAYETLIRENSKEEVPTDSRAQLRSAIRAVFRSWENPRAVDYRRINAIPDDLGTAVTVQAMVYGNLGDSSGSGVGFTRNPSSGAKEFYGEFLVNAQGEDVVAGTRTPLPIQKLADILPAVYDVLKAATTQLEEHYRDVQDFEFTVQEGELYLLQTRNGKRTGPAAVRIAVDMVDEGLIDETEAIRRVTSEQLEQLLHPRLDPNATYEAQASGLPASPGAATGKLSFSADDAVARSRDEDVILVRRETSASDIHGMAAAAGILTARGGMTSHAAVVARGMGKCCIVGVEGIVIDEQEKTLRVGGKRFGEEDHITLDGASGRIIEGQIPTVPPDPGSGHFAKFMTMADRARRLRIRANADRPEDAVLARKLGAEGIGLCRTEHMFFAEDRLRIVQEMILSRTEQDRQSALDRLLPLQREDFKGLFRAMAPLPVTVRLLDPPLHEFLPDRDTVLVELALLRERGAKPEEIAEKAALLERLEELVEVNPMMGHRGCRLGITYPEITEMQARAIIGAAMELHEEGLRVTPEIMVPLVGLPQEILEQKQAIDRVAEDLSKETGVAVAYSVGTMIELPRAALVADEIAEWVEFFSFGTNDLTQMTFGFSRDDAGKFLRDYVSRGIIPVDPFQTLDRAGVGELVRIACEKGRRRRPDLQIGICGEHGGDPASIEFFDQVGLDYVSCSPYRVPIARLAAARATLGVTASQSSTV